MTRKVNIHGIISLLLILDATAVATISIAQQSALMAGIYLFLFFASLVIISITYCAKCNCRGNCNHLIMGWVSKKLSKKRYGGYTTKDIIFGVLVPFLPTMIIPQFYLYHNLLYLLLYWVLFGLAALEINFYVCRSCRNSKCLMCKRKVEAVDL